VAGRLTHLDRDRLGLVELEAVLGPARDIPGRRRRRDRLAARHRCEAEGEGGVGARRGGRDDVRSQPRQATFGLLVWPGRRRRPRAGKHTERGVVGEQLAQQHLQPGTKRQEPTGTHLLLTMSLLEVKRASHDVGLTSGRVAAGPLGWPGRALFRSRASPCCSLSVAPLALPFLQRPLSLLLSPSLPSFARLVSSCYERPSYRLVHHIRRSFLPSHASSRTAAGGAPLPSPVVARPASGGRPRAEGPLARLPRALRPQPSRTGRRRHHSYRLELGRHPYADSHCPGRDADGAGGDGHGRRLVGLVLGHFGQSTEDSIICSDFFGTGQGGQEAVRAQGGETTAGRPSLRKLPCSSLLARLRAGSLLSYPVVRLLSDSALQAHILTPFL
jgi:hypothetical protein